MIGRVRVLLILQSVRIMATKWEFLEPWRAALSDSVIQNDAKFPQPPLKVSFVYPEDYVMHTLTIPLRTLGRQDAASLQRLREAMELFTLLSCVNNKAFTALMLSLPGMQSGQSTKDHLRYPRWEIRLSRSLSTNDAALVEAEVTWGAFIGFPNDPWEYSSEFRAAAQTLAALGMEEPPKASDHGKSVVYWKCTRHDSYVRGEQKPIESVDTYIPFQGLLRRLFDVNAPPVVRACATCCFNPPLSKWNSAKSPCDDVDASIKAWTQSYIPELATALARTSTSSLRLSLSNDSMDSRQEATHVGVFLDRLVCGRSQCAVPRRFDHSVPDTIRPEYSKLDLSCLWLCDRLFVAVCSAVVEISVDTNLAEVWMGLDGSGRWPWLIYALCCGASDTLPPPSVHISRGTLTMSDISIISEVLKTNYPQPLLDLDCENLHQYGFVDIQEGIKIFLRGVNYDDGDSFVVGNTMRCRALYDPADGGWVEFVVAGYGVCRVNLGDGARFTPDSGQFGFRPKRLCGSLRVDYVRSESAEVLMDLLTVVTQRLRFLSLGGDDDDPTTTAIPMDLCALATACPDLQDLRIRHLNVVVSAHDSSLREWPVKAIYFGKCTITLSDLIRCLRNRGLRMSRELVELKITSGRHAFDNDEMEELKAHDGEFLPVTKEKFPAMSKAAMISVVTAAAWTTKPIHRLDAYVLSLIFGFASIPEQRSVVGWC